MFLQFRALEDREQEIHGYLWQCKGGKQLMSYSLAAGGLAASRHSCRPSVLEK